MKSYTPRETTIRKSELVESDGPICIFCNLNTPEYDRELEHLDNNIENNKPENHALTHKKCNLEKRYNPEYQIIAKERLALNQTRNMTSAIEDKTEYGNSPEIEHNVNVRQFVRQRLEEIIKIDNEISYSDALNGFTYLAGEKFGHCSQITIRRHLDAFCSPPSPFMKIKNSSGKLVIVPRSGN